MILPTLFHDEPLKICSGFRASDYGTGPLAITIEVDEPPESPTIKIETPDAKTPVLEKLFKSSLKGLVYWKANHPNLVTGTHNPALLTDTDETCLDCHDQNTSCKNCRSYAGVKPDSSDREFMALVAG